MLDKYINEYLRTHSDEALEGIILETKSMVYHIINRYYNNNCHFDKLDYFHMIVMKYPEWIDEYQFNGVARAHTFLYTCAKNYMLKQLRRECASKRAYHNHYYFEDEIRSGAKLQDVISENVDIEAVYEAEIKTKFMYDQLYDLFAEDARYYIAHLEGYKIPKIAQIYNVSPATVKRAIAKIRHCLKTKPKLLQSILKK